jgi:hypothetical protein
MFRYSKYVVFIMVLLLAACGGGDDGAVTNPQYSVTLTDISLNKKGSTDALTVSGLPARGATLTQK